MDTVESISSATLLEVSPDRRLPHPHIKHERAFTPTTGVLGIGGLARSSVRALRSTSGWRALAL